MIDELTEKKDIFLPTGGGVVINAENCALLKSRGKVIYLHAKPDNLAKRMKHDKVRPLLQQGNRLETLNHLYRKTSSIFSCSGFYSGYRASKKNK